jgi:putative solute:sodium symporter small subunit
MSTAGSQQLVHWQRTRTLMIIHLVIWFVFSFVIHWFAADTNNIRFMGFPLGYYMAAQGSLIVFVVQLFVFSKQQDKIDRECGMAEGE